MLPDPFTLRELVWMADARMEHEWDQTASLMAVIANCHRDPKRRRTAFAAYDFHPFHASARGGRGLPINRGTIQALRVFLPKRKRRRPPRDTQRPQSTGEQAEN